MVSDISPMQRTVCEAANISKSFGNFKALDDVSLEMYEGEVFGLLGSNGAGKSTLTKIMAGLLSPDAGEVRFLGNPLDAGNAEFRKIFAVVPQEISCYYGFTVAENIRFFGIMYGLRGQKLDEMARHLTEWLGLVQFRDRPVNDLSGGYKRLLNIACALVNDPLIIFLDEPTVGLDPNIRRLIWDKIRELKMQGKTICLTTHYLDEAQALCNRIGLLVNGRLIVKGDPMELIKKYGGYRVLIIKVDRAISENDGASIRNSFQNEQTEILGNTAIISFKQEHSLEKISLLTQWIEEQGYGIISSVVKEPELEDVFLNLTGQRMRD